MVLLIWLHFISHNGVCRGCAPSAVQVWIQAMKVFAAHQCGPPGYPHPAIVPLRLPLAWRPVRDVPIWPWPRRQWFWCAVALPLSLRVALAAAGPWPLAAAVLWLSAKLAAER